jgi:hypothetical protein
MPLEHSSSDKAFRDNIKKEINSGRDQKQAVAIAYHEKRENMSEMPMKEKKMSAEMPKSKPLPSEGLPSGGMKASMEHHGHHEGKNELKQFCMSMPKLGGNKHGHKK